MKTSLFLFFKYEKSEHLMKYNDKLKLIRCPKQTNLQPWISNFGIFGFPSESKFKHQGLFIASRLTDLKIFGIKLIILKIFFDKLHY